MSRRPSARSVSACRADNDGSPRSGTCLRRRTRSWASATSSSRWVVVESTSDYWRPFFYLLEARGLVVWLVNARDVKQVPGRPKTDKLDAIWLAKLNGRGM